MNVGCTQMHLVTLLAIAIGLVVIGAQVVLYLVRTHDSARLWYIGFLVLLLILNIVNGLLPDPNYVIPLRIQHIIVSGMGFLTASYMPLYFYRAFGLEKLRFHALYGVPFCLLLPYLIFFVVSFSIHGDLTFTQRYGYIVPTFYSLILLTAIGKAIRYAYREHRNRNRYVEEVAAYIAILPWSVITLIVYFDLGQMTETLFTNLGLLALSGFLLYRSVMLSRAEQKQLESLRLIAMDTDTIHRNCYRHGLSPRETEIAVLLCQRLSRQEVAERLFISERTVDKHTQNIFAKANVTNRIELINKFNAVS